MTNTSTSAPPGDARDAFYLDILDGLAHYLGTPFAHDLARTVLRFPARDMADALNKNQFASKLWLRDEVLAAAGPRLGTVWVLGGWKGLMAALLLNDPRLDVDRVVSIDVDATCAPVAESLNASALREGRFAAVTADMLDLDYAGGRLATTPGEWVTARPDLVVNTSCEHLAPFAAWYDRVPAGTLLALQSNDMFDEPVHVNCVPDLESFKRQAPMSELLHAGVLPRRRYTRFMLIGRK